jgi:hypothetical protein
MCDGKISTKNSGRELDEEIVSAATDMRMTNVPRRCNRINNNYNKSKKIIEYHHRHYLFSRGGSATIDMIF